MTICLNDLVEDDSERDLWLRLFQSLALNERFWNLADLKIELRRQGGERIRYIFMTGVFIETNKWLINENS